MYLPDEYHREPPPGIVLGPDGLEEYIVEAIIGHRKRGRHYQFLTKWVGYPEAEATWEHVTAFSFGDQINTIFEKYVAEHGLGVVTMVTE